MKKIITLSALLVTFLVGQTSYAQTELPQASGYAGLLLGYTKPHDLDSRLGYGAEIGINFPSRVSGFGYLLGSSASQNGTNISVTHYGVGANYMFQELYGIYAGLRLGGTSQSKATDGFSWGLQAGWDYHVAPAITVGVEPILMFDTGSNSGTTLYLLATGKFWF